MTATTASLQPRRGRNLSIELTRNPALIEAAQRLRYRVFSEEYGSDLGATTPGLDADSYDGACDHLVVTDVDTGELVATTRILHQDEAISVGGFYSRGEFDLTSLESLPGTLAELGRTCVHPDYRNGGTITLLWSAVAEYLIQRNVTHLIGCASISMADGGAKAWHVAQFLQQQHLSEPNCRVTPKRPLPHLAHPESERSVDIPPLIRAYMRLGATVCGEPCWDPEFRCADMLVLLKVSNLAGRYSRHFMRRPS